MILRIGTFGALVFLSLAAAAKVRAVQHPPAVPSPSSVMWIGAHPDDEAVAAPLLAYWCREQKARCTFLVMTRGANGACLRPDGCAPDVSSVRAAEAGSASQYFGADSFLLTLEDGGGVEPPRWGGGGRPDPIAMVADLIAAARPELILTFDPRHGTSCHPDHRETANIVLAAVRGLSFTPSVYLLETRLGFSADLQTIEFHAATPQAIRFDANQTLTVSGAPAWEAAVDDMKRHPSQFDESWIAAIRRVAPEQRAVHFAPAEPILQQPVMSCP